MRGSNIAIMKNLDSSLMQDVEGGRKFNADCAFALAGLGIATTGLILALGPFAAGAAAIATTDAIGLVTGLFGSGLAFKDIVLGCF